MAIVQYEGYTLDLTGYELQYFQTLSNEASFVEIVLKDKPNIRLNEYEKLLYNTQKNLVSILKSLQEQGLLPVELLDLD